MNLEELKQMPIVTVEQVLRFKDAALSALKESELQHGLTKIALEHKTVLLESCEKALRERDGL